MSPKSANTSARVLEAIILAAALLVFLSGRAAPEASAVDDAAVARFEGAWAGNDNVTPAGPIPFALIFDREPDGSLHALTALSVDTWVDLRIHRDDAGEWAMSESASLAGLGQQSYTLHPTAANGDTLTWVYRERPDFLSCRTAVVGDELFMLVHLRGEEHVRFHLRRVSGQAETDMRAGREAARSRPAGDDFALLRSSAASARDSAAIRAARERVLASPEDPRALLALADALRAALDGAPLPQKAAYAQEMLATLRKAVAVAPALAGAHHALAEYYLHAPPIAGGSLELAEREAEALAALESPLADVVRAEIAAKRAVKPK